MLCQVQRLITPHTHKNIPGTILKRVNGFFSYFRNRTIQNLLARFRTKEGVQQVLFSFYATFTEIFFKQESRRCVGSAIPTKTRLHVYFLFKKKYTLMGKCVKCQNFFFRIRTCWASSVEKWEPVNECQVAYQKNVNALSGNAEYDTPEIRSCPHEVIHERLNLLSETDFCHPRDRPNPFSESVTSDRKFFSIFFFLNIKLTSNPLR